MRRDWFSYLSLVYVDLVDCLIEFVEVFVLLLSKTVKPNTRVFLVICYQVRVATSKIFLTKFHRSLQPDLLHASVFWLSFNIRSWNIESTMSIKLALWAMNNVFRLPFFVNVNHGLRFLSKQRSCSFERFRRNGHLSRSSKTCLYPIKSLLIYDVLFVLPMVFIFLRVLVKHRCVYWISVINSCDAVSPTSLQSSISLTE